jgi:hypothetical protein
MIKQRRLSLLLPLFAAAPLSVIACTAASEAPLEDPVDAESTEIGKGRKPRKDASAPPAVDSGTDGGTDGSTGATPPPPATSGWPGPDNTGVPPGTTLTPSGSITASQAGAVYSGLDIVGEVTVNAPNVTFRNCRIRGNAFMLIRNNSSGLVVEDSELFNRPVAGQNNCHNAIGFGGFTVRRSEIAGCENGADMGGGNVTFEDNYVHDLDTQGPSWVWGNEPHTDGIQIGEGAQNLVIRHNWIDPSPNGGVTSAIIMHVGAGTQNSNVRIEDNYLDGTGASYAIYVPRHDTSNVFINRNRMLKGYGYTACVLLGKTVTTFDDNRDANTGALIGPDNGVGGGCIY